VPGGLLLPSGGAVAGRSAAALYGAGTVTAGDPVEVVIPRHVRFGRSVGLLAHSADLVDGDTRELDGMRLTTPARTCWDLAQWLDLVEAVVVIDLLVRRRLVTVADLEAYAARRRGVRGWRRLLRAATLADAGAESPQESRLRVRLVLAGLPAPVTQYVIECDGRFVARVDLAWPEHKVAVEYDGLWHAAEDQIHRDRQRLNHLVNAGWVVLHITSKRLREDFDTFASDLKTALRARS